MSENKDLSLTELASINDKLSKDLTQHTSARNFLWRVHNGDEPPPKMVLYPQYPSELIDKEANASIIDTNKLSPEGLETILLTAVQHEEAYVFETWQKIAENSLAACDVITKLKKQREEQLNKPQQEPPSSVEYSEEVDVDTLAFPGISQPPQGKQ